MVAEAKGEALAIVVVFNDDGPRHDSAVVLKEGVIVAVYECLVSCPSGAGD